MRLLISVFSVTGMALLSLGYVMRRRCLQQPEKKRCRHLSRELHKHHKTLAAAVYLLVALHAVILFMTAPVIPVNIVSGCLCLFLMTGIAITYFARKKLGKRWLCWHRLFTALLWPILILHVLLQIKH